MGNINFLMNEEELEDSGEEYREEGLRTIIKGNDVPDQAKFDDHNITSAASPPDLRIISVNVWYTDKKQISVIQMIYSNGKDFFMGNKTAKVTGEMEKEVLEV
jgi:hypothetical protein